MYTLGISAFYHDSAAALVGEGMVIAAAQEERFTRKKNDPRFPHHAIEFCLSKIRNDQSKIDHIVFYENPLLKFERIIETHCAIAPKGVSSFIQSIPIWLKNKFFQKTDFLTLLHPYFPEFSKSALAKKILFAQHHLSHAASAYYPSPFDNAAILTIDGVGEWATTSYFLAEQNSIKPIKEIRFPHSLGLLYSSFTYYLGFEVNSGEYKMMGLAPYGEPGYKDLIFQHLIDVKEDGSFRLDLTYFSYCTNLEMINSEFTKLFNNKRRQPSEVITQFHMDVAASIQSVIEEVILKMVKFLASISGKENLCLAGGVALNCVNNGKLVASKLFKNIWIQPAAGDAGGSIGAALCGHYLYADNKRKPSIDCMNSALLGPEYSQEEIERRLTNLNAVYDIFTTQELINTAVKSLAAGKIVGWFQGRMEFGPRALGNRSILADPRPDHMQNTLNLKVKNRESFRPFAPAVLKEKAIEWFTTDTESPYMLITAAVKPSQRRLISAEEEQLQGIDKIKAVRSRIPAVTHVNYSARLQTVSETSNPIFYNLLKAFDQLTGCPMLVNTSFNVKDEPIVESPEEAYRCFMSTNIDICIIGNCCLIKETQK